MPSILVLGATSDIGYAIAKRFAKEKYDVQLAARNKEQLHTLQSDLQVRYNINCTIHAFDAEAFDTHSTFFKTLPNTPDVTACVFGYMNENEKVITDWSEAQKTINTNYTGAVSILNIVAQEYAKQKKGTIIGISSVAGERGRQSNFMYGSAKAGFTAYLSGLRNYLYHHNVHVLTVLPGFVATKMTEHLALPKLLTAEPHEVADAVYEGATREKNTIYVKWFWRWIMYIIKAIPESIFKRKKL